MTDFVKGGELRDENLARLKQSLTTQKRFFHTNASEIQNHTWTDEKDEAVHWWRNCEGLHTAGLFNVFPEKKDLEWEAKKASTVGFYFGSCG